MGILTKEVEIKLWGQNVRHYNNLGYEGKYGDVITVKVEDLQDGSNVKIEYLCDYCHEKIMTIVYADYTRRTKEVNKMVCRNCMIKKHEEVCLSRYGVSNYFKTDECREKIKNTSMSKCGKEHCCQTKESKEKRHNTCVKKYGESYRKQFSKKAFNTFYEKTGYNYPSQSPEVREKMIQSSVLHYGVDSPQRSLEVRKRTEQTNLERYGCIAPSQNEEVKEKQRLTNIKKYGHEYTLQAPEVRQKITETLYQNGTVVTSKQQIYIFNLYNSNGDSELNFPLKAYNLDICFPEEKLAIEYDGGFHDGQVKLGNMEQEEFNYKEIVRNNIIKQEGYKIMRIQSSKDYLPSDEILLQILDYTRQYFSDYPNRSWINFNIDSSIVRNAEQMEGSYFNFGELRKIKKSDIQQSA